MSKAQSRTRWPTTIRTRNPTLKPNQMKQQYPPQEAQVKFPLWIGRDMGIGMRFFGGEHLIFSIVFRDVPQILLMFLIALHLLPCIFPPKFSSCNLYRVAQRRRLQYIYFGSAYGILFFLWWTNQRSLTFLLIKLNFEIPIWNHTYISMSSHILRDLPLAGARNGGEHS